MVESVESLPVQVEVSVQDHFFAAEPASISEAAPISEEVWQSWFQQWLASLKPNLAPNQLYELSLRLTNDAEIQQLNDQYRHKAQPTDVLAFAALETDYPQLQEAIETPLYLGDIVISVETARRQAASQGQALQLELAWLAAHALLHLLGWDHPDEKSLLSMLERQEFLLQTVGLKAPYYREDESRSVTASC